MNGYRYAAVLRRRPKKPSTTNSANSCANGKLRRHKTLYKHAAGDVGGVETRKESK
jgi:hypothetical protein